VFSWPLQVNGKDSTIIVKPDYTVVVLDIAGARTKIEMRKIVPKEEDKKPFFVGRNWALKVTLSYSQYYEKNPEENPEYYPKVSLLDAEELKEAEERDAQYTHAPVEVDFGDSEEMAI